MDLYNSYVRACINSIEKHAPVYSLCLLNEEKKAESFWRSEWNLEYGKAS